MPDEEEVTPEPGIAHCRHCGKGTAMDVEANPDWLCPECQRYQDAVACPTCHQTTRASLLPADLVPPAAKPRK